MRTARGTGSGLSLTASNPWQRNLLGAAVASALALPMLAQAQVQIYGRANVSAERVSVSGSPNPVDNEKTSQIVDNSSRVGVRGREDLGGGLTGLFQIESRTRLDSGGDTWASRDSYVGLQSNALGTIRLGRTIGPVYYATYDYISMHNHDTGNSSDAFIAPATVGNAGFMNNTVWYSSPKFGSFSVDVALSVLGEGSVGEPTVERKQPRYIGLVGAFDQGPLHAAVSYAETKNTSDLNPAAGTVKLSKDTAWTIGGLYDFKQVVVGALYEKATSTLLVDEASRTYVRVAVMVPVDRHEFHVNVGRVNHRLDAKLNSDGATQMTLGYNYNLSKRTKAYAFYTKVDNKTNGNYGFQTQLAGVDNSSVAVGVRHNF